MSQPHPAHDCLARSALCIMTMEEGFYQSDALTVLRLAISMNKPIILIANQLGREDVIPRDFESYQGAKALLTEELDTPAFKDHFETALRSFGIDPASLEGSPVHEYAWEEDGDG